MTFSELCREPKRSPSACWNSRRQRLAPLEVVWRSLNPPGKGMARQLSKKGHLKVLPPEPEPVRATIKLIWINATRWPSYLDFDWLGH